VYILTANIEPYKTYKKLRSNSIKCNNVFSNEIKHLHVSANDGHYRKATNTSKEMLHMYYIHVVLYGLH
jgi:hypothetical protein